MISSLALCLFIPSLRFFDLSTTHEMSPLEPGSDLWQRSILKVFPADGRSHHLQQTPAAPSAAVSVPFRISSCCGTPFPDISSPYAPDPCAPSEIASSADQPTRSEEHTSELQSRGHLVCRLLLEKK